MAIGTVALEENDDAEKVKEGTTLSEIYLPIEPVIENRISLPVELRTVNREPIIQGEELSEIFNLTVDRIKGKGYAKIHGTIQLVCPAGSYYIFSCTSEDAVTIYPKDEIPLAPRTAIPGEGPLALRLTLEEDNKDLLGGSAWKKLYPDYDTPSSFRARSCVWSKGRTISAVLNYAVYSNAVVATVEIKLMSPASQIYGRISASNTMMPDKKILFFNRKRGKHITVNSASNSKRLKDIPLSRSVVAVPLRRHLLIDVDLLDPEGHSVVKGEALFYPKNYGRYMRTINANRGQSLQVIVTWWTSCDHQSGGVFIKDPTLSIL